ncbi:hypothetical protein ACFVJS_03775 [Nocardioides sp. NPDC057772]|uniref:hypothetical protein n=1 Tax=Nocardioides sp. NPDC057772 TaxID=3346245 RepID=UPI00367186A1
MNAQITLDELNCLPLDTRGALARDGYYLEASADGTTWSNAEAILAAVTAAQYNGASYEVTGWEGNEVQLHLRITGVDSAALAIGAAELVKVLRRETMKSLTYIPPDGTAPPTVWDVLVATWDHQFDDFEENRPRRSYLVSLWCKPFSRSAELVSMPAVAIAAVAPTVNGIDNCSATTGWTTGTKRVSRINLITNGSFRYGIQGWGKGANTDRVVWDSNGMRWAVSDRDAGRSHVNYLTPMQVVAGSSYRIHMRIYQAIPTTALGVLIRWYNAAGAQIGSDASNVLTVGLGVDGSWRTLSTARTAPAGAVTMNVFPFAQYSGSSGSAYSSLRDVHVELESTWTGSVFDGDLEVLESTTEYVWSGAVGRSISYALTPAPVTTSGGKIRVTGYGGRPLSVSRAGGIDLSTADYLRLRGTWAGSLSLNVTVPGVGFAPAIAPRLVIRSGSAFDAYFPVQADSITAFSLSTNAGSASSQSATLEVDQVDTSTGLPLTGTGRSGDFQAKAYGTMPAEAAITVENTADLGRMVLLYTRPSALAFDPALRSRRTAGTSAVNAAASNISGFTEALATTQDAAVTWELDAADLPAASYLLAARLTAAGLTSGSGYTLNWRAVTVLDGATETTIHTGSRVIKAAATTYGSGTGERITEIGLLSLPTMNVLTSGDASAKVRLQLWVTGGGAWNLDESWIFDTDKGDLTVVEPVSPLHRLTVTPASADRPVQTYLAEHEPSPGDITARDVSGDVIGWSAHKVDPRDGDLTIYIATLTSSPNLSAELEYFPRWDVYAAPIEIQEEAA